MASGTRVAARTAKPVQKARDGVAQCATCGVRLSSYNPGPHCYAHTLDVPWKGPGPRHR